MAGDQPKVGVLALQGDVREHRMALETLGAEVVMVRTPEQLDQVSGLVIPGGESTVIDKLAREFGLQAPIRTRISAGMPVFGTCAGLILLADRIVDATETQESFGGMQIEVRRNAFGRQSESFEVELAVPELGEHPVHATFIRAPIVESHSDNVRVLASLADGKIVAVEQGALMGAAFHPEINDELRFHARFLDKVCGQLAR